MLRRCVACWWACPWSPPLLGTGAVGAPPAAHRETPNCLAWPGLACPALPCSCSSPGLPGSASQPANPCCPSTRCAAAIKVVAGQMLVYPNEYALPLMPNFGLPPPPVGMLHVKVGWAGVCGLGGGCVVCAGGGGTHALVPAACLPASSASCSGTCGATRLRCLPPAPFHPHLTANTCTCCAYLPVLILTPAMPAPARAHLPSPAGGGCQGAEGRHFR
jgi:hypothetical protein